MGKWFLAVLALLIAAVATVGYFLSNTDALRAPLEQYLSEKTGLPVVIRGELTWQLLPPLQLQATGLTAGNKPGTNKLTRYGTLNEVRLAVSPFTVLKAPQAPKRWTITAFTIDDLNYREGNQYWVLNRLQVNDLQDNNAAPFHTALIFGEHQGDGTEDPFEESVALNGKIKLSSTNRSVDLIDLEIDGTMAVGLCDAKVQLTPREGAPYLNVQGKPILPVNDLRDTTWNANCKLSSLTWLGERFEDVALSSSNEQGKTQHSIKMNDAFGGTGAVNLAIDASHDNVTWDIQSTLANIQLESLFTWLRRDLGWRGPLDLEAQLNLEGNHKAALVDSVQGTIDIASQNGFLDIKKIKAQAQSLSQMLGNSETVSRWPEELNYQSLSAQWNINGEQHQLAALVDNIQLNGTGRYSVANDKLRLNADLLFLAKGDAKPLPINSMLENLPIPLKCKGTLRKPDCGIDSAAGTRLLGDILAGRGGGDSGEPGIRDKIEQTIEEEIPEQWQDAARSLLDLLGDSLSE